MSLTPTKVYFISSTDLGKEDVINLKISITGLKNQLQKLWNRYIALEKRCLDSERENKELKIKVRCLEAIVKQYEGGY